MKNLKSFVSGMLAMVLAVSLVGTAAAAAGKLQIGTAGVIILDKVKVEPGKPYTADGADIPAVVTYQDPSGKIHNYLPVELLTSLLRIPSSWSETRNSVVLGVAMERFTPENTPATGHVYPGGKKPGNPTEPVLGQTLGRFTEIDPETVDTTEGPTGIAEDQTRIQTVTGFSSEGVFIPENGKYVVFTVTNNGQKTVTCQVGLDIVLGRFERFPSVDIEPGKTLTRAFEIADGTPEEQAGLVCAVRGFLPSYGADVTVSLMQYK